MTKYQIILLGNNTRWEATILTSLEQHLLELGVDRQHLLKLDETNFGAYRSNAPAFCVYFGDNNGDFKSRDILQTLIADATLVLPVVENIERFAASTPQEIHKINGFELSDETRVESLVNLVLDGLGLTRISRRLFISYRRSESTAVAIQLYEQLEKNGFDVFLDTHSVKPGDPFQEELWHRLADTDVVALLNTPDFLTSEWTREELAKANAMQIGILQVLWPSQKLEVNASLSIPFMLKDADFGNHQYVDASSYLTNETMKRIVEQAELLRARSLAARQDNLITEFMKTATKFGRDANLQPHKFIKVQNKKGHEVLIIPTVGVPQAFNYNKSDDDLVALNLAAKPEAFLLFDHINIRDNWLKHLDWLDNHLPIKTLRITNVEKWIKSI